MKKILCLALSLVFMTQCVIQSVAISNTYEEPVLKSVTREPAPIETEVVLQENVLYDDTILSQDGAIDMLNLGFDVNEIETDTVDIIYDTKLDKELTCVSDENMKIEVDSNGQICRAYNLEDLDTITEPTVSSLAKQNKLDYLIDKYESLFELQEYELSYNTIGTDDIYVLTWNKKLNDTIINPYDTVIIVLDIESDTVLSYAQNAVSPNTDVPIVKEAVAKSLTCSALKRIGITTESAESKLTVFRPNFYWESGEVYKEADFVRLAWEINVNDGTVVYIDATTGENLGGSQTQSYERALGVVPGFYKNYELVQLANAGMRRLGFEQKSDEGPVTWEISRNDMLYVINDSGLSALYLGCHGDPTHLQSSNGWTISTSNVTKKSGWKFVFLDACSTSIYSYWFDAFGMTNTGCAFIGWNVNITNDTVYDFDCRFWSKIYVFSRYTILSCVVQALTESRQAGYSNCNPGFWGDTSYRGE